jgi:dTDP-L-rhamnose 4-epimerase
MGCALRRTAPPLVAEPTSEEKPLRPPRSTAVGKRDHEELTLAVGAAYGIPAVALRFFNVYGARQALSNPYTGVAAIFASRLMSGAEPLVFEDGNQTRDFIDVRDITRAVARWRSEATRPTAAR